MDAKHPLHVPECFFGSTPQTRQACNELVREAWTDGTWRAAIARRSFCSIDDHAGPIVVRSEDRGSPGYVDGEWNSPSATWQVNALLECPFDQYKLYEADPKRQSELFLEGIQHGWFVLALLEGDQRYLPFLLQGLPGVSRSSTEFRHGVVRPMIDGFFDWLPVLGTLNSRLAIVSRKNGVAFPGLAKCLGLLLELLQYDERMSLQEAVQFHLHAGLDEAMKLPERYS